MARGDWLRWSPRDLADSLKTAKATRTVPGTGHRNRTRKKSSWRPVFCGTGSAGRGSSMRLRCLVRGHEDLWQCDPGRVFLCCAACGRETAGWTLDLPAPRPCSTGVTSLVSCRDRIAAPRLDDEPDRVCRRGIAATLVIANGCDRSRESMRRRGQRSNGLLWSPRLETVRRVAE